MKKHAAILWLCSACVCLAFVLGLFFGRQHRDGVTVTLTTRIAETQSAEITLLVNINTASLQQLTALPGIGEAYAQNIIDYREANGPFEAVEELLNVDGIGQSRLEAILDYVTVGGLA